MRNCVAGVAAWAQSYGPQVSIRVRQLLAACAAAATPQVVFCPTVEMLEDRQLLSSTPFNGTAFNVSTATIQAENFDNGGEGVSFHDTTAANLGGQYRNTAVDINSGGSNGYNVGYTAPGEWMKYTINVPTAGTYALQTAVADTSSGAAFHAEIDGTNVTGSVSVPNTGGWFNFHTVQSKTFNLSAGTHVMRIYMDHGDANYGASGNYDYFKFVQTTTVTPVGNQTPFTGTPFNISTDTIQAEKFDNGGEGVSYHDTTPGNIPGNYRNTAVDINAGGSNGYNVGYTAPGEWMKYTIDVPTAGTYALQAAVAQTSSGAAFHAEIDGANVTGSIAVPNTGGWYNFHTVQSQSFSLSAGTHVMRIYMDHGGSQWGASGNYDYFKFVPASTSTSSGSPTPTPVPLPTGSENATVSGSNHGDSQAPTPVMNVKGTSGQAEHSVFVDALSSTLGAGTPLNAHYSWNFGDSGSRFNTLEGWNAGHIYDNPGTYTITLTITNSLGKSSSLSTQVTITPNTRKTIYVDNVNGNDSNSGTSTSQAVRSWQKAQSLMTDNTTVLFHRGQTFDFGDSFTIGNKNVVVGAYGSGAAPIMMKVDGPGSGIIALNPTADQVVVENLTFNSIYVPQGNIANHIPAVGVYPAGRNVTVRNNTFLNIDDAVNAYRAPTGLLVQDNTAPLATGIRGYFVWMNGSNEVVLGNTVANSTREHVMRSNYETTQDALIADNNFDNQNRQSIDPADYPKTTIDIREGSYVYIVGNKLSDCALSMGPDQYAPAGAYADNIVVDGNWIHNARLEMAGSVHHVEVRNNLFDDENTSQIALTPDNNGGQLGDITIENNTGVSTSMYGAFLELDGSSPSGIITVKNNLFAAPNLLPGHDFAAPVYVRAYNLNAFSSFSNNVWPIAPDTPYVPGGEMFCWPTMDATKYITGPQWDALSIVHGDTFRQVTASSPNLQVSVNGQMAGAILPPSWA